MINSNVSFVPFQDPRSSCGRRKCWLCSSCWSCGSVRSRSSSTVGAKSGCWSHISLNSSSNTVPRVPSSKWTRFPSTTNACPCPKWACHSTPAVRSRVPIKRSSTRGGCPATRGRVRTRCLWGRTSSGHRIHRRGKRDPPWTSTSWSWTRSQLKQCKWRRRRRKRRRSQLLGRSLRINLLNSTKGS